ncbi:unnamed protein product, partial [marine sediment metagenome]
NIAGHVAQLPLAGSVLKGAGIAGGGLAAAANAPRAAQVAQGVAGTGRALQLPGTIPAAAAIEGAYAGLQPGTAKERAVGAATGGVLGAAGQGVSDLAAKAIKPTRGMTPAARFLEREGIRLSPGDATDNKALHMVEETLANKPGATTAQQDFRIAQQQDFNAAVLKRAGINARAATENTIDDAYNKFSDRYGALIGDRVVDLGDNWWEGLFKIDKLSKSLPKSLRNKKTTDLLDDMMDMTQKPMGAQELQAMRSALSTMSRDMARSG